MIHTMHLAAQYLASAAISFIEKKADDSHTNLGWKNHTLETHPFPNDHKLGLNYKTFTLEWIDQNGNKTYLLLDGTTHKVIIDWIAQTSLDNSIKTPYYYDLHYELPYENIKGETLFKLTNQKQLNTLINNRDLAQQVFKDILESNALKSPIRIWPHHFDTGIFTIINDKLSIGIGMAIPDTLIDDFYLYISGYNAYGPIVLNTGDKNYYNNDWKGFAKPMGELNEGSAIAFCQMAIDEYSKYK